VQLNYGRGATLLLLLSLLLSHNQHALCLLHDSGWSLKHPMKEPNVALGVELRSGSVTKANLCHNDLKDSNASHAGAVSVSRTLLCTDAAVGCTKESSHIHG
jgi:hypothetical protein